MSNEPHKTSDLYQADQCFLFSLPSHRRLKKIRFCFDLILCFCITVLLPLWYYLYISKQEADYLVNCGHVLPVSRCVSMC